MFDFLIGIVENIITDIKNLFIALFVPSEDLWSEKLKPFQNFNDNISQYSNLLKQFSNILETTLGENYNGPPDFTVDLWGVKCTLVNWEVVKPYRPLVHCLVIAIVYGRFLFWLLHKISCVIFTD